MHSTPGTATTLPTILPASDAAGIGLSETDPFDRLPGAEQPIDSGLIADEPDNNAASPSNDPTGDEDDAMEKTAKLHRDV